MASKVTSERNENFASVPRPFAFTVPAALNAMALWLILEFSPFEETSEPSLPVLPNHDVLMVSRPPGDRDGVPVFDRQPPRIQLKLRDQRNPGELVQPSLLAALTRSIFPRNLDAPPHALFDA